MYSGINLLWGHLEVTQEAHKYESHQEKVETGIKNKNYRLERKNLGRTRGPKIVHADMK